MDNIIIPKEQIATIIENSLPKLIEDSFSGYSSPVKKAVEDAIKEKEGVIRELVDGILTDIVTNTEFRQKLGEQVLTAVLSKSLRN